MQDFLEQFEEIDPEIHGIRLPKFKLSPEEAKELNVPVDIDNKELFRALVERGFQQKLESGDIPKESEADYRERLNYEVGVVEPSDFVDYFLEVWQDINLARKNHIPVGPGRGSAAGSLMLYMLGITQIDSLKYNLYFERFLSESRLTPVVVNGEKFYNEAADIDTDISDSRRGELIELLRKKHEGHFVKLSTISTLQSRRNIKEVCKIVLNYSEQQALEISSLVPSLFGKVHALKKAIEEEPKLAKFAKENEQAFSIALKLSELPCARSSHASAYLLTHDPLVDSVPCELGEGELVSSYDMNYAMLYNIKLDLLGLKAVGIIDDVCKSIGIDVNKLDLSYENVYRHLQDVKCPYGLFQVSGSCNLGVVNAVKPKNIDHLSAVTALARPGALVFTDQYAKYVNEGEAQSVHPFFDEVLKPTAGLALYQESALQMCEKLGLSKVDGESIRRGISKKKKSEIEKWKEVIFSKAKEKNLDPEIPKKLWDLLENSASYSFNRCLGRSTIVETNGGYKMLFEVKCGDKIKAYNIEENKDHFVEVLNIFENEVELYEIELEDGRKIEASLKHKFLCEDLKMRTLKEIVNQNLSILTD